MKRNAETDGRRAAGERSRVRIVRAAQTLIAKHGAASISLRDITDAAEVNVASVNYHFGSKDELCRLATDEALREIAACHAAALAALPVGAGLTAIAEAVSITVVRWLTSRSARERVLVMLSARELLAPDGTAKYEDATRELFVHFNARLRTALPNVAHHELDIRAHTAMGVLRLVGGDVLGAPLDRRSPDALLRLFVPIIAGCLAGYPQP